ncbi:RNA polymerase sigma factor [Flagellimonas sp.]|uniref:RNA polymerase sigma factor n=1 Tax=Flagellimonas sp. TaxID=2058762 RepID=UPI003BB0DB1D
MKDQQELITGLKKGDAKAYSKMVDLYHNMLCVYAYELTNDRDTAQDIVQNVFVNIWRYRLKLKDQFLLKSYLYKSVYNEFLNQNRSGVYVVPLEKKYIDALSSVVEEENKSFDQLIKLVRKEIDNLPPKCRRTFLLSRQEGLSNKEIADYLNLSTKSVEAHITKAFSRLRTAMGDKLDGILFMIFGPKRKLVDS